MKKNSRHFAVTTGRYTVTNVSAPKRFALARLFLAAFACLFAAHSMAATSSSALPAMPETVPVSAPQTTIHAASQSNATSTPQGNGSAANSTNNNSDNNNGNSANGQSRRPAWTLANPSQGQGRAPARARPHATSEVIAIALDIDAEVGDELTFPLPGSEETLVGVVEKRVQRGTVRTLSGTMVGQARPYRFTITASDAAHFYATFSSPLGAFEISAEDGLGWITTRSAKKENINFDKPDFVVPARAVVPLTREPVTEVETLTPEGGPG